MDEKILEDNQNRTKPKASKFGQHVDQSRVNYIWLSTDFSLPVAVARQFSLKKVKADQRIGNLHVSKHLKQSERYDHIVLFLSLYFIQDLLTCYNVEIFLHHGVVVLVPACCRDQSVRSRF